jgi:hypothetical protein
MTTHHSPLTTHDLPWYPMTLMRIHNRPIRVAWNGYHLDAMRMGPPVAKQARWVEIYGREFIDLPPTRVVSFRDTHAGQLINVPEAGQLARWGANPEMWQPLASHPWPTYLPEHEQIWPGSKAGLFTRIDQQSYGETEMAQDAAEREMFKDQAYARGRNGEPEEALELPKWRDATSISYSQSGHITRAEAEARVCRALYFLGGGGGLDLIAGRSNAAVLADLKRDVDDDDLAGLIPRLIVHDSDTDARLITAMRWACELRLSPLVNGRTRYDVLELRSRNVPVLWSKIADMLGVSGTRAKQLYADAIDRITTIANTGTPLLDRSEAKVKQGNREHAHVR